MVAAPKRRRAPATAQPKACKPKRKTKRRSRRNGWSKRADPSKPKRVNPKGQRSYVYVLRGFVKGGPYHYIGFSVDPKRRARQHAREITGGAGSTGKFHNPRIVFMIGAHPSWFQQQVAQMLEWRCKHVRKGPFEVVLTPRKLSNAPLHAEWTLTATRITAILNMLAASPQWTKQAPTYDSAVHRMRYYASAELSKQLPNLSQVVAALKRWPGRLESLDLEHGDYSALEMDTPITDA